MDAVRHHLDANETMFFARQLEEIEATVYAFEKTELKYRQFIPVSNKDNPGANTITYRMLEQVGSFKVIANYSTDLPRSDAYMSEFSQKVKGFGGAIGYSTQDLRAAAMTGISLEMTQADALRRAYNETLNSVCWNGDIESGVQGILDNANIPTVAAANGAGGNSEWSTKTADEIVLDVRTILSRIMTQSKGIHKANTFLMPRAQYNIIEGLPRSTHSDMTVLEFLKKTYPDVTFDVLETELDSAFTSNTEDGAIVYQKSPRVLEYRIPLELLLHPVQIKNLEFIVPGEARLGGVVVRYPLAMGFFTGI